ncbi:hypothetical protein HY570_04170 [Candidatus Micrarchaeota archaeon]|nr:hypothetical protein [Candidatus Micrarchaeota archaeon]
MGEVEVRGPLAITDRSQREFRELYRETVYLGNQYQKGIINAERYQQLMNEAWKKVGLGTIAESQSIQFARAMAKHTELRAATMEFSRFLRQFKLDSGTINHLSEELMGGRFQEGQQFFNARRFRQYLEVLKINPQKIDEIAKALPRAGDLFIKIGRIAREYYKLLIPGAIFRDVNVINTILHQATPVTAAEVAVAEKEAARICSSRQPLVALSDFIRTRKVPAGVAAALTVSVIGYYMLSGSNQPTVSPVQFSQSMRENLFDSEGNLRPSTFPIMPPTFDSASQKVWSYLAKLAERKDSVGKEALSILHSLIEISNKHPEFLINRGINRHGQPDLGIVQFIYVLLRKDKEAAGGYIDSNGTKFQINTPITPESLNSIAEKDLFVKLRSVSSYLGRDILGRK